MGCPEFKAKSASERLSVVETNKLCFNCLGNHPVAKCQSTRNCMTHTQLVQDFEEAHLQVIQDATDEEFAVEDEIRDDFDKMRFAVIGRYESFRPARGTDAAAQGAPPAPRSEIRLPKIALPQFTGDFDQWPSFIALYNTAIRENRGGSDIEKYQYLLASLSGEALGVVKNLPMTSENYAYESLLSQYQNKRKLATQYWRSFVHAKPLNSDSAESLRALLDAFNENTRALKMMDYPVESWDFMLFNHLMEKLTPSLKEKFEASHMTVESPRYEQLKTYLSGYCTVLASVADSSNKSNLSKKTASMTSLVAQNTACLECKAQHSLAKCTEFLKLSVKERYNFVCGRGACLNCLRTGHQSKNCSSAWTCRTCHAKHHSLLHFEQSNAPPVPPAQDAATPAKSEDKAIISMASVANGVVLLSTVRAEAIDVHGNPFSVRILLNSASQANFVTESCLQRGGFARTKHRVTVLGVSESKAATTRGLTSFVIRARNRGNIRLPVEATVLPRITSPLPNERVAVKPWSHLRGLQLADPEYYLPGSIDILLGAESFVSVLRDSRCAGKGGKPDAFNTGFRWVLMGAVLPSLQVQSLHSFATTVESIDAAVGQFWKLEE
ncbi:uncharacterized protein LOC112461799, partial [Temnothorax curvispinosus]|uniref:Uncharacterized protein LOC112461799 n=1 Tax=Temnothorax curvispinosus TaxID=300111 RepID=A0A6J1QKG6_9HYME